MPKAASYVAVVDDELSVRKALARLLTAASFDARTYGSAREFINSLRKEAPDCLVVDVHMPDFSGLDLQRYLHRAKQPIPTIVMTAFDDTEIRAQSLANGAVAYLTKPLQAQALVEAVNAAVAVSATSGNGGA